MKTSLEKSDSPLLDPLIALRNLCEVLGLEPSATVHLDVAKLILQQEQVNREYAFVLRQGLPMVRAGQYRYHGVTEPVWHSDPISAIRAAMQDPLYNAEL